MVGAGFRLLPRSPRLRRWAYRLCATGMPLLAVGCAARFSGLNGYASTPPALSVAASRATPPAANVGGLRQASYQPEHDGPPAMLPAAVEAAPAPTPVNLDSVFRVAGERNAKIELEREKVNQTQLEAALAAKGWIPKVTAGVGYYRHEGGIQNPDGTLIRSSFGALYPGVDLHSDFDIKEATFQRIDAERKRWQQQGELSKVNDEQLLEAANTYIDLLTAQRGEAVSKELEKYQRDALKRRKPRSPRAARCWRRACRRS